MFYYIATSRETPRSRRGNLALFHRQRRAVVLRTHPPHSPSGFAPPGLPCALAFRVRPPGSPSALAFRVRLPHSPSAFAPPGLPCALAFRVRLPHSPSALAFRTRLPGSPSAFTLHPRVEGQSAPSLRESSSPIQDSSCQYSCSPDAQSPQNP